MKASCRSIINQFLRTYPNTFTVEELHSSLVRVGEKISVKGCEEYLSASPFVFELSNNSYMTYSGAFTHKKFSFKPTKEEIQKKIFIPGHRCMPFANSELISCALKFSFLKKRIPHKVEEFKSSDAVKFFMLYGEEYVSQYVASDPANADLNLAKLDFELPPTVKLSGFSLEPIMQCCDFQYGDRLLCEVTNWDKGCVSVLPIILHDNEFRISEDDIKRNEWYFNLENFLLKDFDFLGPNVSIEKQLANVFYEYSDVLCCDHCGSVEELLKKSKKIGFECYGVETRLWHKGENVPAVGGWDEEVEKEEILIDDIVPPFSFLMECTMRDFLYQKKNDFNALMEELTIFQPDCDKNEKLRKLIENAFLTLSESYNFFADFGIGAVRHRALKLYEKISPLVIEILHNNEKLNIFPQQELIILTQLFTHLTQILESVDTSPAYVASESEMIMLSLEGMELNFEEIKPLLCSAIVEINKKGFKIIK